MLPHSAPRNVAEFQENTKKKTRLLTADTNIPAAKFLFSFVQVKKDDLWGGGGGGGLF